MEGKEEEKYRLYGFVVVVGIDSMSLAFVVVVAMEGEK